MTLTTNRTATTTYANIEDFDSAYERLVDARLTYEMLKERGATTGAVIEARGSLHRARAEMVLYRRMSLT